jgi:hypothetical protein
MQQPCSIRDDYTAEEVLQLTTDSQNCCNANVFLLGKAAAALIYCKDPLQLK